MQNRNWIGVLLCCAAGGLVGCGGGSEGESSSNAKPERIKVPDFGPAVGDGMQFSAEVMFHRCDLNKDGKLAGEEVHKQFEAADSDKDGEITLEEFESWHDRGQSTGAGENVDDDTVDSDGNGTGEPAVDSDDETSDGNGADGDGADGNGANGEDSNPDDSGSVN